MANELHTLKIGDHSYPVVPQQVYLTGKDDNVNYPLVFATAIGSSTAGSASNQTLLTDTANSLYYNPSTNALTASKFIGALEGKASSAAAADSAGTASSVAWTGVTGKPTNIAFTDSNVASATKLATARSIWGQSFDGSSGVLAAKGVGLMSSKGNYYGFSILPNGEPYYGVRTFYTYDEGGTMGAFEIAVKFQYGLTIGCTSGLPYDYSTIPSEVSYSNYLTISPSGNVGIGNSSPAYMLDVNGSVRCGDLISFGNLTASGSLFGSGISLGGTMPISLTSTGGGIYNFTAIYHDANQGIFIERARKSDDSSATPIDFVIGARGGQVQMRVDGAGNLTASGEVTAPTFNGNLNGSASKVNGYSVSVVTSLPSSPDANTIYYIVTPDGYDGP